MQGRGRFERRGGRDQRSDEREPVKRLPIPDEVTGLEIDPSVRQELRSLPKTLADDVARNLVMVAQLLDEDADRAYAYSRVALRLASRVAAVREAAGFASYATERYAEALAEFRASRRMTGTVDLWPVMADCERGLGRPERALEMAGAPEVHKLDKAGQVEMRLVAAGARRDLGQADAAVVTLQSPELASSAVHPWTARLRYAYADALLAVGRENEAREWFAKALEADHNGTTDASDRLAQLDGVEFVDAFDEEEAEAAEAEERVEPHKDDVDDDRDDDADDSYDDFDDDDEDEDEDAEDAADSYDDEDEEDEEDDDADDARHDRPLRAEDVPGADDLTDEADPTSFLDAPFREPAHRDARDKDGDKDSGKDAPDAGADD
ncbi:tetratricopeptide repeat protein [Streptomyces sp. KK5PA1]|uniref:Tetratricopeptide repeat protein n=1 Tax=Actinacidiphila acididurans TaxID=2784346 RepID=A0ABS2TU55_9ACTN|nr:tetratricopeptide repeat protein [Actinacidiphila acididurans]